VQMMREKGCNFGGEQSGHIILSDYATTGDGLVAALQVLALMREERRPLSRLAHQFEPFPQILKNVRFQGDSPLEQEVVKLAIAQSEEKLNGSGRLFIRPSGTEPLIRVMAEGEDVQTVHAAVDAVVEAMQGAA
jgi:phosphoglucosamine mutase